MVGKVVFSVAVDGRDQGEFSSKVRLALGTQYGARPVVDMPLGYKGPFNQEAFTEDVERYLQRVLRTCETPADRAVRLGSMVFLNTTFGREWAARSRRPAARTSGRTESAGLIAAHPRSARNYHDGGGAMPPSRWQP